MDQPRLSFHKSRRLALAQALACSALLLGAGPLAAQGAWPAKPVTLVVPYPAGGVVDVLARAVGQNMAASLGQPVLVINKPGANANIAAAAVATGEADGHTLLVSAPFIVNNPLFEKTLRWKPADFVPVARFALSANYLVVPENSPAKTAKDFVEMARKNPGIPYGDAGPGTPQSMAIEMLKATTGVKLESVVYKGGVAVIPDLVTGRVSMALLPALVSMPHIQSGKLRALANTNENRSEAMPHVPTIAEAGYPEMTIVAWYGVHAPSGTPPEVVAKLSAAIGAAMKAPETRQQMTAAGGEPAFLNHTEFGDFMRSEETRWGKFMKSLERK